MNLSFILMNKEQLYEIHGLQVYDFHIEYKTTVTAISNYTVTVPYKDHRLNECKKTMKVNPENLRPVNCF